MNTLYVLLLFAVVIGMIYLAGTWNTSDTDHYMGFDNLRRPRKKKDSAAKEDKPGGP